MFNIEWMKTVTREQFIEQEKHNAAQVPAGDLGAFYDGVVGVKSKQVVAKTEPVVEIKEPEVAKEADPEQPAPYIKAENEPSA